MRRESACSFFLAVLALLAQCSDNGAGPKPKPDPTPNLTAAQKALIVSGNDFGLKLFRELIKGQPSENVFVSPFSVAMALGMTLNGAEGTTREAMEKTLALAGLTRPQINESYQSLMRILQQLDSKVAFSVGNSIWYRQGVAVESTFTSLNQTYFDARVSAVNFADPAAPGIIDRWVSEKTRGKIDKIAPNPINPLTIMFLINALYFKGAWTVQFDPATTRDAWFTLSDGSQVPCKMMSLGDQFPYFENNLFQAVDLPYGGGQFSMTVILPTAGVNIDSLAAQFTPENWENWTGSFSKETVYLWMPRFTLEYKQDLNDALCTLGMGVAFDPDSADFSGMCRSMPLHIDKVVHKTFVEVNEEGTEAAAVTSVEIGTTSIRDERQVRLDRPFIFVIREHHSQTILFIGRLENPAS